MVTDLVAIRVVAIPVVAIPVVAMRGGCSWWLYVIAALITGRCPLSHAH